MINLRGGIHQPEASSFLGDGDEAGILLEVSAGRTSCGRCPDVQLSDTVEKF